MTPFREPAPAEVWTPPPPPPGWIQKERLEDGALYVHRLIAMSAIVSATREGDGKFWLHLSIAKPTQMPDWGEVKRAKELFIGRDRKALIVLPEEGNYVNIHPFCLHLFCCLETDPLPEFSGVVFGVRSL